MKTALNLDKRQVADYYRQMLLIRRFEEASGRLYMQGKIRGFLHLYIGQEAVAAGAVTSLDDDDYVISHYRDHGHALARGLDPKAVLAELTGKATGTSGGKGGSMHLFDASRNFMGGYAIVGGQLPIAVGLGLAIKYRKQSRVVMCFFGDGAVNEGEFHESMNLASLWKLPVLFFLENNLYGMGSHVDRTHAGRTGYLPYGRVVPDPGGTGRRDGPRRGTGRHHRGDQTGPLGQRACLFGGDDLPVPRPLHGRPLRLSRWYRGE